MALILPETRISSDITLSKTESVCPVCLQRINALRILRGSEVYLQKTCPDHGLFEVIIMRDRLGLFSSEKDRIPAYPEEPATEIVLGCPYDCGLCPEHRQQPCCVLLEVTQRCDLACPICFASAGKIRAEARLTDPDMTSIENWYQTLLSAGGPFNIQLSGGEPCLRDDLPEIISVGKRLGFSFFQVNTNGLRIASDRHYLAVLKQAGLSTVYLQFDGTTDDIYQAIRGRRILSQKIKAIKNCQELNIGVVLVPTIKPGINDRDIGNILRFALKYHPAVRGVHFQPISYFGRYPAQPGNTDRITLSEIIEAMQDQTAGLVHASSFKPSGGPNRYCSFNGNFVVMEDGSLKPIIKRENASSCTDIQDAVKERIKAQSFVSRNWTTPQVGFPEINPELKPKLGGWDSFLARAKTHLFAISGMAFQDVWTLDLDRLHDCYIMVVSPDNRLIPFCAYNLTSQTGDALYRK
ncbi:MAG TPA: radical SAM protein [Leptolinea sp.]